MEPNLEGFRDAQARLIKKMADSIVLLTPIEGTWPDGTKLDPETSKPLDPWVRATGSGFASATVVASVAFRPLATNKAGINSVDGEGALGIKGTQNAAVILMESVYQEVDGPDATEVEYANRRYRIEDRVYDPHPTHRILYLEPL